MLTLAEARMYLSVLIEESVPEREESLDAVEWAWPIESVRYEPLGAHTSH